MHGPDEGEPELVRHPYGGNRGRGTGNSPSSVARITKGRIVLPGAVAATLGWDQHPPEFVTLWRWAGGDFAVAEAAEADEGSLRYWHFPRGNGGWVAARFLLDISGRAGWEGDLELVQADTIRGMPALRFGFGREKKEEKSGDTNPKKGRAQAAKPRRTR